MDRRKYNKGIKGNKGGTGRPTLVDEKTRALVITKSWDRILKKFEKKNKSPEDEKQLDYISIEIAKKTIPQNIDLTTQGDKINQLYSDDQIDRIITRYLERRRTAS